MMSVIVGVCNLCFPIYETFVWCVLCFTVLVNCWLNVFAICMGEVIDFSLKIIVFFVS